MSAVSRGKPVEYKVEEASFAGSFCLELFEVLTKLCACCCKHKSTVAATELGDKEAKVDIAPRLAGLLLYVRYVGQEVERNKRKTVFWK